MSTFASRVTFPWRRPPGFRSDSLPTPRLGRSREAAPTGAVPWAAGPIEVRKTSACGWGPSSAFCCFVTCLLECL